MEVFVRFHFRVLMENLAFLSLAFTLPISEANRLSCLLGLEEGLSQISPKTIPMPKQETLGRTYVFLHLSTFHL